MHNSITNFATPLTHVAVLLATYNGVDYIEDQLKSIQDQTHHDWSLWVSDDGSTDGTLEKIATFQSDNPDKIIHLSMGPKSGAAANFLTLLANPDLPAGAIAFCDQDDIWMPDKLQRALSSLMGVQGPTAYSCTDIPIDHHNDQVAPSKRRKIASFRNALVQNIMRGNSIVLNETGVTLMRSTVGAALTGQGVKFHDWWVYLVITGAGGQVILDPKPGLFYRQHARNVLGANVGLGGKVSRAKLILSGQFSTWISGNIAALAIMPEVMTDKTRADLETFQSIRKGCGVRAARAFWRGDIRHQRLAGSVFFAILALLGRL